MNIAIVGTGYGTGKWNMLSELGLNVVCVDVNEQKLRILKGIIPIYEPGLERMVLRNMESNRLSFSTSLRVLIM